MISFFYLDGDFLIPPVFIPDHSAPNFAKSSFTKALVSDDDMTDVNLWQVLDLCGQNPIELMIVENV